jgi:hypothetical protein
MLSGQVKYIVREKGSFPTAVVKMAELTFGRKSRGNMRGMNCLNVIILMTSKTVSGCPYKLPLPMTFGTIQSSVYAFQKISCGRFMIPFIRSNIFPRERHMTVGTMGSQSELIPVILPPFPVTDLACCGCPFKNSVEVTLFA